MSVPAVISNHFDSVSELLKYGEGGKGDCIKKESAFEWDLRAGYEGARSLAVQGWVEGAEKVRALSDRIQAVRVATSSEVRFDVAPGLWVDPDRYDRGEPEIWGDFEPSTSTVGHADLVVNIGALSSVNANEFLTRGAAIVAMIDRLEASGIRTSLTAVSHALSLKSGGASVEFTVALKRHEERLELEKIAFCLAHPAFLRRLIFAARECLPVQEQDLIGITGGNSGRVSSNDITPREGVLYFPVIKSGEAKFQSADAARDYVNETLKTFEGSLLA